MTLYRDNARPLAEKLVERLRLPVVPEPDAPRPWGFYTRDDFPEFMSRLGLTGVGVEVGTYRGGYATYLLNHWAGVLHVVDPWEYQPDRRDMLNTPDQHDQFAIAMNALQDFVAAKRCVVHRRFSVDAARDWTHGPIDWVYIDALHDYESCLADMRAWAPLVRPGGVLSGHDYLDHPPGGQTDFGVVSAVRDWCAENGYDVARDVLTTTEDGYPSWVLRLRAAGERPAAPSPTSPAPAASTALPTDTSL